MNISRQERVENISAAINKCIETEDLSNLKKAYDDLVYMYENEYLTDDQDYRSGSETYGLNDISNTMSRLNYIQYRWGCSFRVRWLIETINPNYVLFEGSMK